ncbi:translation initiation factor [Nitratifractor sp.]
MREKLFEMGAKFDEGWHSDNKKAKKKESSGETRAPEKHRLWFRREKRRGKWVTIAGPFALSAQEIAALLKRLKSRLGTGGTIREDTLEFQGDIVERLKEALKSEGYTFRK